MLLAIPNITGHSSEGQKFPSGRTHLATNLGSLSKALAWSPSIYTVIRGYQQGTGMFSKEVPGPRSDLLMAYCQYHGIDDWGRCVGAYQAGRITEEDL